MSELGTFTEYQTQDRFKQSVDALFKGAANQISIKEGRLLFAITEDQLLFYCPPCVTAWVGIAATKQSAECWLCEDAGVEVDTYTVPGCNGKQRPSTKLSKEA